VVFRDGGQIDWGGGRHAGLWRERFFFGFLREGGAQEKRGRSLKGCTLYTSLVNCFTIEALPS